MASAAQELSYACVIIMFEQLLSKRAVARNSAPIDQKDSSFSRYLERLLLRLFVTTICTDHFLTTVCTDYRCPSDINTERTKRE